MWLYSAFSVHWAEWCLHVCMSTCVLCLHGYIRACGMSMHMKIHENSVFVTICPIVFLCFLANIGTMHTYSSISIPASGCSSFSLPNVYWHLLTLFENAIFQCLGSPIWVINICSKRVGDGDGKRLQAASRPPPAARPTNNGTCSRETPKPKSSLPTCSDRGDTLVYLVSFRKVSGNCEENLSILAWHVNKSKFALTYLQIDW